MDRLSMIVNEPFYQQPSPFSTASVRSLLERFSPLSLPEPSSTYLAQREADASRFRLRRNTPRPLPQLLVLRMSGSTTIQKG